MKMNTLDRTSPNIQNTAFAIQGQQLNKEIRDRFANMPNKNTCDQTSPNIQNPALDIQSQQLNKEIRDRSANMSNNSVPSPRKFFPGWDTYFKVLDQFPIKQTNV